MNLIGYQMRKAEVVQGPAHEPRVLGILGSVLVPET